jgi:hypothetical protein
LGMASLAPGRSYTRSDTTYQGLHCSPHSPRPQDQPLGSAARSPNASSPNAQLACVDAHRNNAGLIIGRISEHSPTLSELS